MERLGCSSGEDDDEMEIKEESDYGDNGDIGQAPLLSSSAAVGFVAARGRYFDPPPVQSGTGLLSAPPLEVGGRKSRPREEKERTKLRERHRRAITTRILAGLRQHGNYNLRVRADINEVIAALAREAGWVVLPDGTTFPASEVSRAATTGAVTVAMSGTPISHAAVTPIHGKSPVSGRPLDYCAGRNCGATFVPTPNSLAACPSAADSFMASCLDSGTIDIGSPIMRPLERDFSGTVYVPIYIMLPHGVINLNCELVDHDGLVMQLRYLKAAGIDGVMVNCWWGIVEAQRPQEYNWSGYKRLFHLVRELRIKLEVAMSFHECESNMVDDFCIPLPRWVMEISKTNPDIFFTDKEGRRNSECLTWGIDKERALYGRTALEVYYEFMRSFRIEFNEFFEDEIISMVEIGSGPCGELCYPSHPFKHGWRYPGIGEFQCYDRYLQKSLRRAAEARGHNTWARGPDNAGCYNSTPEKTGFFRDGGEYDGYYGRFFLGWYSQVLLDHADQLLLFAKLVFEGSCIAMKLSGVHWWYKTASHAAELTSGFYNPCNRDGYLPIAAVLKKHGAALNFMCTDLHTVHQQEVFAEGVSDPEGLAWQVLNAAWDAGITVASENASPCFDRDGYNRLLENAKPLDDPDGRHLLMFTYSRLGPALLDRNNFAEFERFVKRMHGEAVLDLM